jgi:3-methyladenine DNA glycosylase AlkD
MAKTLEAGVVVKELQKEGSKEKALILSRFFKTGKGQYAEGDVFLGVTVPAQRTIAKKYQALSLTEIEKLLNSPYHECRLTGLIILVNQYREASVKKQKEIAQFYLNHRTFINNWDLVDLSARQIVGHYIYEHKKSRSILYRLSTAKRVWDRRIAIIATHYLISQGDFSDTLKLAEIYLTDTHDLMHTATGWMLREVGKKDKAVLVKFLEKYKTNMPRTALRYSIEHFSKKERLHFMQT